VALVWADLWVVGRSYFVYSPPAAQLFGPDPIVNRLRATELPYRVLDLGVYPYSWLMASRVPVLLGHHGNELRYFDDLLGGQGEWSNLSANILSLYAVRYVVSPARRDLPGFREVLGPVDTQFGPAFLLEADSVPPYSWVVRGGVKAAGDASIIEALVSPQFPTGRLAVYPDTAGLTPPALATIPPPSARRVVVDNWRPGYIELRIEGESSDDEYLVVAENWYPDWQAIIDGTAVPTFRANNTLLSVQLPPGVRAVELKFESAAYEWGKAVSATSLAGVAGLFAIAAFRRRKSGRSGPAESAQDRGSRGRTNS
jgi:hypothetical protein